MKKQFVYALLVILITPIVVIAKGEPAPPIIEPASALATEPAKAETDTKPSKPAKSQQTAKKEQTKRVSTPEPVAPAKPKTCREAIAAVIPANLQAGFVTVMVNENRAEDPHAVGAVNSDGVGSQDFGCFQINNHWHPAYFSEGDWRDPEWAAEYALRIYQGRLAQDGVGWTAWYAVEGILW